MQDLDKYAVLLGSHSEIPSLDVFEHWSQQYIDGIDSNVFSGDMLQNPEAREQFRRFLARWTRELARIEEQEGGVDG
ncbi:hypothetical protein JXVLWARM_CDS_0090 [Burkholderia phage Bm1]